MAAIFFGDAGRPSISYSQQFDFIGAARGIRTPDPIITNDVLYQLSYCGRAAPERRSSRRLS
jgi:hypothetical protein